MISTIVRVWDKSRNDFVNLVAHISIDADVIARELGDKAFKNKSKSSKAVRGGVMLQVVYPPVDNAGNPR